MILSELAVLRIQKKKNGDTALNEFKDHGLNHIALAKRASSALGLFNNMIDK